MLGAQRSSTLGRLISLASRRQSRKEHLTHLYCVQTPGPNWRENHVLSLSNFLFASYTNFVCLHIRYMAFMNACIYSHSSSLYDTDFPHATSLPAPNSAETGVTVTNGKTQPYGACLHRRLLMYTPLCCVAQCSPASNGSPCWSARLHEYLISNYPSRSIGAIHHCAWPA